MIWLESIITFDILFVMELTKSFIIILPLKEISKG